MRRIYALAVASALVTALLAPTLAPAACVADIREISYSNSRNNQCDTPTFTESNTVRCTDACGYTVITPNSLTAFGACDSHWGELPCTQTLKCKPLNGINYTSFNPPARHMTAINRGAAQGPCGIGVCFTTGSSVASTYCSCVDPADCVIQDPLILSLRETGYQLTSLGEGVQFDMDGDAEAAQVSWTARDGDEAFLVLDRNKNGLIDDGTELFGDLTAQHPSDDPNGFRALALFDDSLNGGNEDRRMSAEDAVFKHLRVWKDANHNGVSEPNELASLRAAGLEWIDLTYLVSDLVDRHGNQFRYWAPSGWSDGATRKAWNVFLVGE